MFDHELFILVQSLCELLTPRSEFPHVRRADENLPRLFFNETFLLRVEPAALCIQDGEAVRKVAKRDGAQTIVILRGKPGGAARSVPGAKEKRVTGHAQIDRESAPWLTAVYVANPYVESDAHV